MVRCFISAMSHELFEPGTTLAGKYQVVRLLGEGGMGIVLEAIHKDLGERVAIKFLHPDLVDHPQAKARFLREAQAAAKIRDEHVAHVKDVGSLETGEPYIVMEFLEGRDVGSLLRKGPLRVEEAVDYAIQACMAIAEAHRRGIIHRDLKPANLFVTHRIEGSALVKVLDFGISTAVGEKDTQVSHLTADHEVLGSVQYMSPEQLRGARHVDERTDIYSLAVSLYEMLTGTLPFPEENHAELCAAILTKKPRPLVELRPSLPQGIEQVVLRAMASDRNDRFLDAISFAEALKPWAPERSLPLLGRLTNLGNSASMKVAAEPYSEHHEDVSMARRPTERAVTPSPELVSTLTRPRAKPNKTPVGVGLLVLALLVMGSYIGWSLGRGQPQPPAAAPVVASTTLSLPASGATTATSPKPVNLPRPEPVETAPPMETTSKAPTRAKPSSRKPPPERKMNPEDYR